MGGEGPPEEDEDDEELPPAAAAAAVEVEFSALQDIEPTTRPQRPVETERLPQSPQRKASAELPRAQSTTAGADGLLMMDWSSRARARPSAANKEGATANRPLRNG